MLPALAVYTPPARSAAVICRIALPAPRSLNDPIGWRHSSLRKISAGVSSTLSRTSGVRSASPAILCCAARMASIGTGSSGFIVLLSKRNGSSRALRDGLLEHHVRRREVFDRQAERFEQRDLVERGSAGDLSDQHVANFAENVRIIHRALGTSQQKITGLVQCRLPSID